MQCLHCSEFLENGVDIILLGLRRIHMQFIGSELGGLSLVNAPHVELGRSITDIERQEQPIFSGGNRR